MQKYCSSSYIRKYFAYVAFWKHELELFGNWTIGPKDLRLCSWHFYGKKHHRVTVFSDAESTYETIANYEWELRSKTYSEIETRLRIYINNPSWTVLTKRWLSQNLIHLFLLSIRGNLSHSFETMERYWIQFIAGEFSWQSLDLLIQQEQRFIL